MVRSRTIGAVSTETAHPAQPAHLPVDRLTSLPAAVLRPITGNAFECAVEQLATAIRLGALADGDLLPPERELSERLGISRNTLREAIAALRESGLVATRRGRGGGTRVTYVGEAPASGGQTAGLFVRSGAALTDALTFRRVVEPGAAWLAATQPLAGDQRAWLADSLQEVEHAADAADAAAHRVADSRLHLAIATLSGSPMLIDAVTRAQAAVHELLMAIPVLRRNIEHSGEQHRLIVTAILGGDADGARAAMEEHCDATSALLRGLIG
ncbi:MAG: FadR family transcriptional regulator [Humibacillus sp.]|nr:FadR family transcriptional regulator [Humibacillus sp.]